MDDPAAQFVAAVAFGFRQLSKIVAPAELRGTMRTEIGGGTKQRPSKGGQHRKKHQAENGQKYNVHHSPVKTINPRKHAGLLLWHGRIAANTGTTASTR